MAHDKNDLRLEKVSNPPLVQLGDNVRQRWLIMDLLGSGGFGEVYRARDMHNAQKEIALKLESKKLHRNVLKLEIMIYRTLHGENHVARYYGCGSTPTYNFLALGLLGPNISILRKQQKHQKLSIGTLCDLAIQMITAIQIVHKHGILHRDIKPSNFAMGCPGTLDFHRCYILDFGLSFIYRTADGNIKEPRPFCGFRGTTRYASLTAHLNQELSRRDDLWSFFYMIIELGTGSLPWRRLKDRSAIYDMKIENLPQRLIRLLPRKFEKLIKFIASLKYEDTPDYDSIKAIFQEVISDVGVLHTAAYDWEETVRIDRGQKDPIVVVDKVNMNENLAVSFKKKKGATADVNTLLVHNCTPALFSEGICYSLVFFLSKHVTWYLFLNILYILFV